MKILKKRNFFFFFLRLGIFFFKLGKKSPNSHWERGRILAPEDTKTRIDVYETLCPQQMLVHEGGKIKNWGGECRDVTPTKSLSQNIRVDVNREVKFL